MESLNNITSCCLFGRKLEKSDWKKWFFGSRLFSCVLLIALPIATSDMSTPVYSRYVFAANSFAVLPEPHPRSRMLPLATYFSMYRYTQSPGVVSRHFHPPPENSAFQSDFLMLGVP